NATAILRHVALTRRRFSAHLLILVLSGYLSADRRNPTDL
ncbi:hypothetical protein HMPREF1592_00814, partial [Escherichia coli 907357]